MKLRKLHVLLLTLLLALAPTWPARTAPKAAPPGVEKKEPQPTPPPQQTALVINVGVVAYDDYDKTFGDYDQILRSVSNPKLNRNLPNKKVVFRLALGSYSDVLDWYKRDLVDIAFLTPALIADLRATLGNKRMEDLYVASHDSSSRNPYDHVPPQFDYKAMCAVAKNTPISNYDELRDLAAKGRINFLFVDPLSLSGRILPEYVLRHYGKDNPELRITNFELNQKPQRGNNSAGYTYSPKASIEQLSRALPPLPEDEEEGESATKYDVAFFSRRALPADGSVKEVSIPELDGATLPEQAIFVSRGFSAHAREVAALFDVNNRESHFQRDPSGRGESWLRRYNDVSEWADKVDVTASDTSNQMVTLEQIGQTLRGYQMRYGRPARLALVLSGGGAKCAYQLGAIEALESEIDKEPDAKKEKKVDIDLVVGTSGGAINALCVALGLTRDGRGKLSRDKQKLLESTWREFDQKDFFSPWPRIHYALGLSVGLFQALVVIWSFFFIVGYWKARRWKLQRNVRARATEAKGVSPDAPQTDAPSKRAYRIAGGVMIALAALNLLLLLTGWSPLTGASHYWHHLWLLLTISLASSVVLLVLVGVFMICLGWWDRRPPSLLGWILSVLMIALFMGFPAVIISSLFDEKTVSRAEGVNSVLANKLARMVDPERTDILNKQDKEKFAELTSLIESRLERDLVITGSRLSDDDAEQRRKKRRVGESLPSDLYFYRNHEKCPGNEGADVCDPKAPATDERFRDAGHYLMDVVVGSSSIYPVFPSRQLDNFDGIADVNIIDGGFAHNSPIEAAVRWGATHIILVEASPEARQHESYLLANAFNAFNHLYVQAQLLDSRARGKVEIFTLRPSYSDDEPGMCTFDFNSEMVGHAIKRGRLDALDVQPHFRREPGEPKFTEIGLETLKQPEVQCPCKPQ